LSGASAALGIVKWHHLSRTELLMTLVGGFSFAIAVTPWIAHDWLGIIKISPRAIAAMTYVFGSGSTSSNQQSSGP
jgi:hypothetical protein